MAEQLSEDLIAEILCLLPLKNLVGFKCVSKRWNILISNVCVPRILRQPLDLSGFLFGAKKLYNPKQLFMDYISYSDDNAAAETSERGFVESYTSLLPSEYSPYEFLDCCNGLILLMSSSVPRYYVCNPATKQCVAIPKSPEHLLRYYAVLAFNPCESSHYKVIRFVHGLYCSASNPTVFDIFSSETQKWVKHKVLIDPPVAYGVRWVKHTVYLDGMLYKLSLSNHLLGFDLVALTARAIEIPYEEKVGAWGFIGESKGVLHYANNDGSRILIWQFDFPSKTGRFWMLKHCICINNLVAEHSAGWSLYWHSNSFLLIPYAIHPTSDIIFLGIPKMIFSYHLKTGKLELFCEIPDDEEIVQGHCSVYCYSQCFVMLDNLNNVHCMSSQIEIVLEGIRDTKLETRHDNAAEDIEVKRAPDSA